MVVDVFHTHTLTQPQWLCNTVKLFEDHRKFINDALRFPKVVVVALGAALDHAEDREAEEPDVTFEQSVDVTLAQLGELAPELSSVTWVGRLLVEEPHDLISLLFCSSS